jgi:TIR domain/Pentapeptide repeats (8 copies)
LSEEADSPRAQKLTWANLSHADLDETDQTGAGLGYVNFNRANFSRTNFTGVLLSITNFAAVDLRGAKGLETVEHRGPSTIGIDTIYKSCGKIPDAFLRGCGVPDEFISYIGSMVGRPIEYYSCFISYSTHDQEFAERLHADLQAKGVRCWFAPHDIQSGKKIYEQIDEAIRLHDRLLLILSGHSMSSEWVQTEIAKARKRETKEGKRVLFPVRLVGFERLRDWECFDGDTGKDSAREIREYFIPDFSNWKEHDSYQAGLGRLVSDLKAGS